MKSTMQYSVGGNIIDVADDRRDEFLADYQKDYGEGEAPEEVYTFFVNGEPVQVKASRVAEFLDDCEADGVEARRTRNFVMDDGQQLRLDDTAAANFVQARRSGMPMSRGLLKQTGIPEQYGRSAADREALADLFAKLYPEDKGVNYDDPKYDVPRNLGDTVMDAARPIVENPAVQGFAEGLKRSVTDPAELYRETYGDGVITSALLGAQDFANTAVKGGMDVVAKAAGGQDTEVGRAIREAESALPTDQADMGTDGSVTDTVINFANDFSKNTLSTLMKYAAPGVAAVDIAGSVVDNYYDAYNKAIENGANEDKANALASASAGIGAAEGIWLAQSASGGVAQNAVKGALKRIFSMGGKMGTAAGARDIVEQGIEGAENPDLVRAGKEALKGAAEGAAFEATSMGVHGLAGMDGSKRSTKKSVEAFLEDKAKQEERAYAKKNYDSRLSDEANADIDATVGEMIKNEVVPSWRQAEEVRQKAIEKLATREKGESHEAVEQAVMEAAQEVQARLHEPTRVETPALERRQTEAKMRENERWAKRSEELVKEYGEAEAAKRLEAEKAAEAAKGADEAAKKAEHEAREADIEAAFREFTEEPVAKPDGKGKMVKEKPKSTISDDKQKAVREDATMQDIMARAKLAKTDAEKSSLQDEFNNRWHQLFDKPAETEAPKMDYAEAVKTLGGMDAALPERELRKKMAQWEEHADDPRAAKMAEAARAVLERRASQGKPKPTDEVVTNGEKTAKVDKETPESVQEVPIAEKKSLKPDGKGRMKPVAEEAPKPVEKEAPTPKKTLDVSTEPTDEGFKAWAVDSDGKPMQFASETDRAQSRKLFDDLVRSGAVDGKTGANIDAEEQVKAPTAKPKDTANENAAFNSWRMKNGRKDSKAAREAYAKDFDGAIRSAANGETAHLDAVIDNFANSHLGKLPVKVKNTYDNLRKKNPQIVNREVTFGAVEQYVKNTLGLKGKKAEKMADTLYSRFNSALQQHQQNVDAHDAEMRDIRSMAAKNAARTRGKNAYADYGVPASITSKGDLDVARWVVSEKSNGKYKGPKDFYDYCKELVDRADAMPDEYVSAQAEAKTRADKAQLDETRGSVVDADGRKWKIAERASEYDRIVDETTGEEYIIPKDDLTVLEKYNENTTRKVQTGEGASVHNEADGRGEGGTRGVKPEAAGKAEKRVDKLDSPKPGTVEASILSDAEAERMLEREAGDNPTDAKKPLNAPPAPLPGSPGNAKLDPNYDPKGGYGSGVKDPIHRQQILDKVSELFKGKVAIRGKNTEGISRSAAGHFEPGASIIRSRDMGSLRTIPHEIGHFVHYLYDQGAVYKNGVKQPYPRDVARDLLKLGQKLYPNKQPNGGYQREGIAEIFKYYMQGNIDGLKAEAPKAYEWLTRDFAKEHPDVMAKVDEIRDMVDRYQNQSVEQEVRGAIRRDKNAVTKGLRKAGEILKGAVNPDNWTQENLIDKFAFINKGIRASGMDDLLDWQGAMKRGDMAEASRIIENHPIMKAKLYNGKAGAKAFASMRDGLTSLDGTRRYTYKDAGITPPSGKKATDAIPTFKEIFADIPDARLDDWQDYALARIFKENYHAKGLKSGITPESIDKFLDLPQYKNNKIYEKALQDWTDYNHAVLHTLVDGGVMSQATYDRICKDNAIYTKVMRVMDDTGFFGRPSKTNGGKVVNKRKGSDRQVEDLFEATLVDHEKIIAAAMQGDLFRSIVELGERAEKIGTKGGKTVAPNWIHEVKNAKEAVKFSSEKIKDDFIGRAANELGSEDAAKDLYESMYGINGDKLTIFREKPSNGKNGIVSIYDQEGNLRTFELPEVNGEAWAKGLLGMNDAAKEGLFESYFKLATETTKMGATMLNPTFAVRNMVRDTLHASVMNEYGKFVPGVGTAEGLAMDLLNTDTKRIYDDMCLGMGTFLGRTKMDRAERSVGYLRADNWFERELNKGITKAIADFVGFSENSSRLKEFKNVYDYMKSNGATDSAAKLLAGCNALDITVDFQRMGHGMQKANRWIPFVNAGVQGLEQFGRSMGLLRSEAWQLNQGSVFEKGKRADGFKKMAKTAAKGALNLSSIAMAAAAYNLSDEDRRKKWMELPAHEKWNYTSFGDVRIPVPFELGYAFMSVPTAIIAEMAFGDKGAVAECLETFAKSLPLTGGVRDVALIAPAYSVATNRDWKDQEIVPQNKKDNLASVDWYGPKTTKASIALGRALYKTRMFGEKSWMCAPAYIDTLLDGYSGGMWSRIAKTCTGDVDWSMTRATDMPIIGTFFRRPNTSRVINDFYERSQLLTAKYNSPSIGISPEEYGEKVLCDEIKAELSPIFNENRGVMLSDMPSAERNRLVDDNIKKAQDIVRGIEKGDLRRKGIARAANGLANEDSSDAKIASDLAVLKNVSESEAISAFRSYCNEWVYVTNKSGKRTGKRHRRMSDTETIQKRIRLIRKRMRNR